MPVYFDRYIALVEEDELVDAFEHSLLAVKNIDRDLLERIGSRVYAPGKWTVKDILQHLIDSERVFAYRALRFARADSTVLPGFDEEHFARMAQAERHSLDDLIDDLMAARRATMRMFASFDASVAHNIGICFNKEASVLALGFTIVGHQKHHLNVIQERYHPDKATLV